MQAGMDQYLVSASMLFSSHAGIENTASSQIACEFQTETYHITNIWIVADHCFKQRGSSIPPTNFVGRGYNKR